VDKRNHLFIFSHGFQGNSYDMKMLKNNLKIFYPNGYFFIPKANEGNTLKNI
jgi:hypothetical protein